MTVVSSGTWSIDATTTSGTELAAYLNEWMDAFQTSQASPSRPPAIQKGGVWTKTLGATDIALMLYDGTTDQEIGRVAGGNATFGGTAISTTAPTPATAGMLWVDNSLAGAPILKIYNGTIWAAAGGGVTTGTAAPVAPAPVIGDLWVDTTTALKPLLKMYDGAAWQLVYGKDVFSIDTSGAAPRVHIGASGATGDLEVVGSVQLTNITNSANFSSITDGGGLLLLSGNNNPIYFNAGGAEHMRLAPAGELRLGTTAFGNYANKFTVQYTGGGAQYGMSMIPVMDNTTAIMLCNAAKTSVGSISVTTTATTYSTSSDYRLKEDVRPVVGASDRLKALKPCNFAWKADGTRVDGFLAHEAQDVVPEAVTGIKDAMRDEEYEVTPAVLDADGSETSPAVMGTRSVPNYQGIDQSKLVPLLTAALQEALGRIEALEADVAKLKGRKVSK